MPLPWWNPDEWASATGHKSRGLLLPSFWTAAIAAGYLHSPLDPPTFAQMELFLGAVNPDYGADVEVVPSPFR